MAICLKSKDEIKAMRAAGRVVHSVLKRCREICQPGVTTREIDEEACRIYSAKGAKGLFKNYPTYRSGEGFPSNLCISVNEVVVHGIAGDRVIQDGDIVGIDCGVQLNGWCGDSAMTILVGGVKPDVKRLCEVTRDVLNIAIDNIRPNRKWSQVAQLMQDHAERCGMSVVKDFVGHGIGQKLHEDPKVPNFVNQELRRKDTVLREGLVIAVEPMCNLGTAEVVTLDDGWTVKTKDGKHSAHYEHTVAVVSGGAEILTDGQ